MYESARATAVGVSATAEKLNLRDMARPVKFGRYNRSFINKDIRNLFDLRLINQKEVK